MLIGLPEVDAVIFLIRVYTYDVTTLPSESRSALCAALNSMSPETIAYKGLDGSIHSMIGWLSKD